jgi:predicted TIM-barrel fold metal-dependent hydrolase
MDQGGTAMAITSTMPATGIQFGDVAGVHKIARDCNEYAAKLRSDYPGRFGFFTTLPLPDIEGSLREVQYALDVLKADGICMWTNYTDKWLGDVLFHPLYEELNRRKAVVYTHPREAACCSGDIVPDIAISMVEYGTNTTRTIASLVFSGTAARYPDIKFIFSHGGGTAPYLVGRMDGAKAPYLREGGRIIDGPAYCPACGPAHITPATPNGTIYELQKFYYDTVDVENQVSLTALRKFVPLSQIVYGTDFPWGPAVNSFKKLEASEVFTASELQAIYRDNALKLLPSLRS